MVQEQTMQNSDFLAEVYGEFAGGTYGWVCTFRADPGNAPADVWSGRAYKGLPAQAAVIDKAERENTYFCTSILRATDDGEIVNIEEMQAETLNNHCPKAPIRYALEMNRQWFSQRAIGPGSVIQDSPRQ